MKKPKGKERKKSKKALGKSKTVANTKARVKAQSGRVKNGKPLPYLSAFFSVWGSRV